MLHIPSWLPLVSVSRYGYLYFLKLLCVTYIYIAFAFVCCIKINNYIIGLDFLSPYLTRILNIVLHCTGADETRILQGLWSVCIHLETAFQFNSSHVYLYCTFYDAHHCKTASQKIKRFLH